jgi:hypothetical protein
MDDQQSLPKQIAIGAFVGVFFGLVGELKEPGLVFSAAGLTQLFGAAIGGVVLYMAVYWIWLKMK